MKLNDVKPVIESSGNIEEQFFSIQDQGMIFDILRNKMYSNPILAICREISCNARDAHRELKKNDVPIQITLPTYLDPFFKVKDFGPGISPDRMANVFIKYTASTKRDDNIQTGGFGLGAKTPFSYSDTFTISTVVNGTKYNYACFIDETKVGKLGLLDSAPCVEENGTEIIIPVKSKDFSNFAQWIENSTRHWDIKPIFKGTPVIYKKIEKSIEGKNKDWAVINTSEYQREVKIVIDGIEYPLDLTALKTYADSSLLNAMRGNLYLYFNIGDLTLSASREQVYLDNQTKNKIKTKLDVIINEIRSVIQIKIDTCKTLWDACVYYTNEVNHVFNNLSVLGKFNWKGFPVLSGREYVYPECPLFCFTKGKFNRKSGNDPNKIVRVRYSNFAFETNHILYINDLDIKEPTPRHVKKAFDDNPGITGVQVICPSSTITEDYLNKKLNLNQMTDKRLSDIAKVSTRKYSNAARLLIYKLNYYRFDQSSYASMEEDSNKKIICMLTNDDKTSYNKQILLKNNKILDPSLLNEVLQSFSTYSIYGISSQTPADRVKEEFDDFIKIDDFLENTVFKDTSIDFNLIKFALKNKHLVDERFIRCSGFIRKNIKNKDSIFLKKLNKHENIANIASSASSSLLQLYEFFKGEISDNNIQLFLKDNPDLHVSKIDKLYALRYPLLKSINSYSYEDNINYIVEYVNLIDKDLENKEVKNV
jgi:hypothetical protein